MKVKELIKVLKSKNENDEITLHHWDSTNGSIFIPLGIPYNNGSVPSKPNIVCLVEWPMGGIDRA